MRSLAYVIAVGALFAGTSVQAQSLVLEPGAEYGQITSGSQTAPWSNGMITDKKNPLKAGYGGSNETIIEVGPGHASFESGVAVSGPASSASSTSGVNISIVNPFEATSISVEKFGSTIIPAGMGFYIQDRTGDATGSNIYTGYGQTSTAVFDDLFAVTGAGQFAYSGFDFYVTSGESTLYSLSGYMSLAFDESGILTRTFGLGAAQVALTGFTSAYDNDFAWAYAWDATDIDFDIDALLAPGDQYDINYTTTVYSSTNAACLNATTCLVAYSGFGDPIGRGGGVSFAARGGQTSSFDNPITGIIFDPNDLDRFELVNVSYDPPGGGAVPEPATWMMMILGFGMLGAALRRRRVVSYS